MSPLYQAPYESVGLLTPDNHGNVIQSSPIDLSRVSVIVGDVPPPPAEPELSPSLAAVIGRNCQRVRSEIGGVTQDDLARHCRVIGLRWSGSKVGHFEAGRSAPTFATVLAVALALQKASDERGVDKGVTLADLVGDDGYVALTDALPIVPAAWIADACRGHVFRLPPADGYWRGAGGNTEDDSGRFRILHPERVVAAVAQAAANMGPEGIEERSGLTEERLARQLGISRSYLAEVSYRLWRSTFSEERDMRAGADANQQKRGRLSRELRAELEKALADGHD
jgi:transcriptional regulator with XRE-family HTH domain